MGVAISAPGAPSGAASAAVPDWQALLQRLEGLDISKPEAVAELKSAAIELIRLHEAQAKELDLLRAELQSLRSVSLPTTSRTSRPAAPVAKPQPPAVAPTGLYGKASLKKLHRIECAFGGRIRESERVYFKSVQEAAAAGYEPCKICKPGG
jgi:hypothetical protein